jgi:hypothetical protein
VTEGNGPSRPSGPVRSAVRDAPATGMVVDTHSLTVRCGVCAVSGSLTRQVSTRLALPPPERRLRSSSSERLRRPTHGVNGRQTLRSVERADVSAELLERCRFFDAYGRADDAMITRASGWAVLRALGLIGIGRNGRLGLPGGKPATGRLLPGRRPGTWFGCGGRPPCGSRRMLGGRANTRCC